MSGLISRSLHFRLKKINNNEYYKTCKNESVKQVPNCLNDAAKMLFKCKRFNIGVTLVKTFLIKSKQSHCVFYQNN